jgi:hypothetical protein
MTGAGPAAQVVSPDVCFDCGTVVIEGIELLDVESNSTLTPIKGAPAPQRLDGRKLVPGELEGSAQALPARLGPRPALARAGADQFALELRQSA